MLTNNIKHTNKILQQYHFISTLKKSISEHIPRIQLYCSSTDQDNLKKAKKTKKFKHTILFPSSNFSINLVKKQRIKNEVQVKELANFGAAYDRQEKREKEFVLHDGPPYANGKLHMGHALNKILKDVIVRYKYVTGHKVNFVPGWDCHGLPIELVAQKKATGDDWERYSPLEIRSKAKAVAEANLKTQMKTFDEWGLFTNWKNHYRTDDPSYTARELKLFRILYEKGFIYQAYMPVHFSPSSRTTLAESELEYNQEHTSPSIYLALRVLGDSHIMNLSLDSDSFIPVYLPIWTTTPWTLPSNMAICVSDQKEYALLRAKVAGREVFLVWMTELLGQASDVLGTAFEVVKRFPGSSLNGLTYAHPLSGRTLPVITSDHVSAIKGTGLVHTAPAHGKEDFFIGLKNKIRTDVQLVDETGRMKAESGPSLYGKRVPEEANEAVLQLLQETKSDTAPLVLKRDSIVHSYPYDWRTKQPTIVRASKQWFFDVDRIKQDALRALQDVQFFPENGKRNLTNSLLSRPYWCISRQRNWGVPIPVFYEQLTGEPLISGEVIDHVTKLILKEGADVWWKLSEEHLLPPRLVQERRIKGEPLPKKGMDTLDIWFDSGSSWFCALGGTKADLYLEGHDQTTGWFQSSLLTAVAATGEAPYKTVFMHGFTVDEEKRKMSKSLRNVFDPLLIVHGDKKQAEFPAYGVSVLRWWCVKTSPLVTNIPFGMKLIASCNEELKTFRTTFAFLLGCLRGFTSSDLLQPHQLRLHDRYLLSRVEPFLQKVWSHFEKYELDQVPPTLHNFIVTEVGNEYVNSCKDTLMFESENDSVRRSVQTTIFLIFPYLWQAMSPILPLIAEEVAITYRKTVEESSETHPCGNSCLPPDSWNQFSDLSQFDIVLKVKRLFLEELSKGSFEVTADYKRLKVSLKVDPRIRSILATFQPADVDHHSNLCNVLQVSQVTIQTQEDLGEDVQLELSEAEGSVCARCYKITPSYHELCSRCKTVVNNG